MSCMLREWKRSRPGSEWAIARTPSHLISCAQRSSSRGSGPSRAIIGTTLSGMGSRARSAGGAGGRVHPVDHPVLRALPLVEREERVAAADALALQRDLHLARLPLELLVRAAVPDPHRPRAVVALRDLAVELEVVERVVLRAHGEAVVL